MEQLVQQEKEWLRSHPKVWQKLLSWEKSNFLQAQQQAAAEEPDAEIPDLPDEMIETVVAMAFKMSPNFLYDFLDAENMIVIVQKSRTGWYVNVDEKTLSKFHLTRKDAEKEGFETAIKELEAKL
jgi:hypothetical protein